MGTYSFGLRIIYSIHLDNCALGDGQYLFEACISDTKNIAGNHILIESEGKEILLAHLKKGSITVHVGDSVNTNTILGQVGNTGNTSEPHLHIHVEYGGEPNTILNGKAVPFTINNQFFVRGDIIE